jgi:predicted Zn-dependent protease
VVSTAGHGDEAPGMARRIAHEAGHLQGLRHCAAVGCVMATDTPEPTGDGAPVGFCERCQSHLQVTAEGGCPGQAPEAG